MLKESKCGHENVYKLDVNRHNQSDKVCKFSKYEYISRCKRECEW